ncbi:MAG: Rieske 2Fe-2S domain-containing protein [Burkholderiales bacterium]|nr:Rieske 2Fe-2S domain-containing protein [Burkholderiales bacterium]
MQQDTQPIAGARTRPLPPRPVLVPAEGENGLFSQSWFPVALAAELAPGQVLGLPFLDGRIVVFRGPDGKPQAMSAYCPHLGADLSVGKVVDSRVQCAFHHWEYDVSGACVKTGVGDPPPPAACLFTFPTQERFGIIWVFNGETPLFELPQLPYPDAELHFGAYRMGQELRCDPWVFAANTPDMQHLKVVHKIQFDAQDPHELVKWHEFGMEFSYSGTHQGGVPIANTAGILGTSVFYRWGMYGGYWRCNVTGFSMPRPGHHEVFSCSLVRAGPQAQEHLDDVLRVSRRTVGEDKDILNTIHYRQGLLTKADVTLGRFLRYLRSYPRAHPSADFIN